MIKSRILAVFLAVAVLAGCTLPGQISLTGSGNMVTQEKSITGFDKVDVSQGFEVDIRQGDAFSVVISIDDNVVQYLRVLKQGRTLKIGLESLRLYDIQNVTMEATITMPELTGLDLSGGSHVAIAGFSSAKAVVVDLSGGSHLRGDIEAGDARFDLSGGSEVTLTGSAGDVTIDASGGSHVELADLSVADANVDASGGSGATVNPSGRLDADASGGSHVYYLGSPTLGRIDTSSRSSVERK